MENISQVIKSDVRTHLDDVTRMHHLEFPDAVYRELSWFSVNWISRRSALAEGNVGLLV